MIYAASAALSFLVAAVIILPYAKHKELGVRAVRLLFICGLVTLLGVLMVAILDLTNLLAGTNEWLVIALVVSSTGAAAYASMGQLRFALRVRRVGALLRQAKGPAQEGLADRLMQMLSEQNKRKPRTKAERNNQASSTFYVVAELNEAGLFSRSKSLLDEMPEPETNSAHWQIYRSAQSVLALYMGERERAEELFFAIPRPGKSEHMEAILAANEALFRLLRGELDEALALVGEERDPKADKLVRRSRDLVRAHLFVAKGEEGRARRILSEVRDQWNAAALTRVVLTGGPAAQLARDILAERGDPYR